MYHENTIMIYEGGHQIIGNQTPGLYRFSDFFYKG